jgi:hypothetical protein
MGPAALMTLPFGATIVVPGIIILIIIIVLVLWLIF